MAGNTDNSIITKIRRVKTCKASRGAIETLPPVTHIVFGDGGVGEDGEPIPPTEEQTSLNHQIAKYAIGSVSNPVETTNRYSVTIPETELTGESISEAALMDSEGDLVAIKTMYAKKKDAGAAFTFVFDDEF